MLQLEITIHEFMENIQQWKQSDLEPKGHCEWFRANQPISNMLFGKSNVPFATSCPWPIGDYGMPNVTVDEEVFPPLLGKQYKDRGVGVLGRCGSMRQRHQPLTMTVNDIMNIGSMTYSAPTVATSLSLFCHLNPTPHHSEPGCFSFDTPRELLPGIKPSPLPPDWNFPRTVVVIISFELLS
uniref:Uncharacterized protein n=1 Tax=Timema poppense TaxID=170557 RepID=A0A7R9H8E1_TIMPO|nr:unnamed protein product [Timema poppensis]